MIKLDSGRVIDLDAIYQECTYDGLLEGIPRRKLNDRFMETFSRRAESTFHMPPVVIAPIRKPFNDPSASLHDSQVIRDALGPMEFLPYIVCIARFHSHPVRNERQDCSLLVILWLQDTWAMPVDAGVIEKIKKVDWEGNARNHTE